MTGHDGSPVEDAVATALESRDAVAFAHAGSDRDPAIRYCRSAADAEGSPAATARRRAAGTRAVAFDGTEWYAVSSDRASGHPVDDLAARLTERVGTGTVLTPARIPHDAAIYLERAGFSLASTDAVGRARSTKTTGERDRIEAAQSAAADGFRRGASLLANATIEDDRVVDGERAVTADRLRRAIDEATVAAGGFPGGNTTIARPDRDGTLRPGEPIVVAVAPSEPTGYHGGLVRTLVVDSEGGEERRAHVGVTQAFRSAQAMLTADSHSVTAVEADLEAEIRGFGFPEQPIETRVAGVGLDPVERPSRGSETVEPGSIVRIEAAVEFAPGRWIRLADVLAKGDDGVEWLAAPSRSIAPAASLE